MILYQTYQEQFVTEEVETISKDAIENIIAGKDYEEKNVP